MNKKRDNGSLKHVIYNDNIWLNTVTGKDYLATCKSSAMSFYENYFTMNEISKKMGIYMENVQ